MNIFAKRLIGIAVSLAALAYVGLTHSKAFETYVKDRKDTEEKPDQKDADHEKQE